ncbi:MAG: ATP/GTP-binding protein [Pseudomonadota bacterium]
MKKPLATLGGFALALSLAAAAHADHKLAKTWESAATLKVPESVRLDAKRKVLYVSNIDGEPWNADGKGSIAKLGLDGKVIAAEWVTGLDCPKGLALSDDGKWLYAADIGGIVVIDIEAGKIKNRIAIPEGIQLNDLVNDHGTLYVSDSKGKKVYVVKNGAAAVYLDEKALKGPNGLLVHDGALYVLDNDSLNRVEKDKSLTVLASGMPGGVDGLENVKGGDFLVSAWSGAVWYVKADGSKELLFDGKAEKTSTADIGWDPATQTVYVPTFFKNTVIAFKVE